MLLLLSMHRVFKPGFGFREEKFIVLAACGSYSTACVHDWCVTIVLNKSYNKRPLLRERCRPGS